MNEGSACWGFKPQRWQYERGWESSEYLLRYPVQTQSLDDLQLTRSLHGKFVFPFLPYPLQFLNVHVM